MNLEIRNRGYIIIRERGVSRRLIRAVFLGLFGIFAIAVSLDCITMSAPWPE